MRFPVRLFGQKRTAENGSLHQTCIHIYREFWNVHPERRHSKGRPVTRFLGIRQQQRLLHIGVPTDYEKSEYDFKRLFNDTTRKLHIPHTSPDYSTRWDELAPGTTLNTPTKCNTSFWHILIVTNQQTVAKVWSHSRNPTNYTADMTGNRRTRKLHWPSHCYTTSEMTTRPTNQSLSFLLQSQKKSTKPLRQMPLI